MVVLASGVAISLTALTSGVVVPANALPVTTTTPAPAPRTVQQEAPPPTHEAPPPTHEEPPPPPEPAPTHEAPVQTFTPQTTVAPAPVITTTAPPVITTTAPQVITTTAAPAVTTPAPAVTTTAAPITTTTRGATSSPATTSVAGPTTGSSTSATATTGAPASTTASSTTASGTETTHTTAAGTTASSTGVVTGTSGSRTATTTSGSSSTVVQAGQTTTPTETPKRLPVNAQNVELAKQSIPVQQNPDPAPQTEIRRLTNLAINVNVTNNPPNPPGGAPHKFDPNQRSAVRQFDPKLVYYDEYYRPIIANPYQQPLQVVYIYQGAPRILVIPPLASAVTELAALGAYSFTAMVLNAVGIPTDLAVGNMMGGGYLPEPGQPPPPPPPPVVPYDNVPVQVQYTDATYQPFVVNRVVDVGNDPAVGGETKVLLDGVTPAWGTWTTNSDGQRQFEVHKTQQFPGMDDPPGEGPLPGDYQMQLASSSKPAPSGLSTTDLLLIGGAVLILALGAGAIALNVIMGRRRPHSH
jgi:hypothetical protein